MKQPVNKLWEEERERTEEREGGVAHSNLYCMTPSCENILHKFRHAQANDKKNLEPNPFLNPDYIDIIDSKEATAVSILI